jgi:pimeloyl-ACP methyl ester carboxylesterase
MRLRWRVGLVLVVALAAGVLLGPRRSAPEMPAAPPELPRDLDAFVRTREARHGDLRAGCEQRIDWAGAAGVRTPLSVVYLHGFSATRQETAPLSAHLARELGANLFEARLRGHGRSGTALGEARAEEWLEDGAEALAIGRRLGERVIVLGASTGGTLATVLLAAGHAADVAALVLVSPNFGPRHPAARLLTGPWGRQLAWAVTGGHRSFEPINDEHAAYWTTRYPSDALVEMQALVDLGNAADLARLETPLQLFYCPDDRVLDPGPMARRFGEAASAPKRLVAFEDGEDPARHVLAGDILSPGGTGPMLREILGFLRPVLGAGAAP